MSDVTHINTISNIEFYFEYEGLTYLREQVHGSLNDKFTNHWYEVIQRGDWRLVSDQRVLEVLETGYLKWANDIFLKKD